MFSAEEAAAKPKIPDPELITQLLWDGLYSAELMSQGQFEGITKHVADNWEDWKKWF